MEVYPDAGILRSYIANVQRLIAQFGEKSA